MNRPEMDTMHVPEGEKQLTDAITEAPATSRVWFSQLAMLVLLVAGIYAMLRGAQQYPQTSDEVRQLRANLAQADASLAGATGPADNGDVLASVRTWREKNAERYGVVRLHLFGCYGLLVLSPVALVCATVVWWRGQFPKPGARFALDGVQIGMNVGVLLLLAGLRTFDAATLSVMVRTPPVQNLAAFLKTPTKEQKNEELAAMRTKLDQLLQELLKEVNRPEPKPEPRVEPARPEGRKPDPKKPDPKKPDPRKPDGRKLEVRKPEVTKPDVKKPDVKKPDAQRGYSEQARAGIAQAVGALAWNRDFVQSLTEEQKQAYRATLKEIVNKTQADDATCPVLIRAIAGLGDSPEAAALETERERGRPAWVDVRSPAGLKFLHAAVASGREADVRKLIDRGINVNALTPGEGHTPLHEAIARRQAAVAELLISKGARIDAPGRYGVAERENPIHRAATVGDAALVKLLVEKGADVTAVDYRGMTPLHCAAASGDCDSAEVLLKRKSKINQLDHLKRTPLDLANESRSEHQARMRDLLVQVGGLTSRELSGKATTAEAAVSPAAR